MYRNGNRNRHRVVMLDVRAMTVMPTAWLR